MGYIESDVFGFHAGLWRGTAASWVNLNPVGSDYSQATGVSGNTQVGFAHINGNIPHAGLWKGTPQSWVDLHPAGATQSSCEACDGSIQAGRATISGSVHASVWAGSAASWTDLNPPGASSSDITDMSGPVQVGFIMVNGKHHAAAWAGSADTLLDLHAVAATANPTIDESGVSSVYWDGSSFKALGYIDAPNYGSPRFTIWSGPSPSDFTLSLNKAAVAGDNSVMGTISGLLIRTTPTTYTVYDDSSLVTTPANVTIPAGAPAKNFQIRVAPVNSQINTTIFAKRGSFVKTAPLALIALVPTAIALAPNPVTGGQSVSARVVINGVAGPGGRTIAVFDNSAYCATPATVTVPAGANQVLFAIETSPVPAPQVATITARVSAGEKSAFLRISP